MSSDKDLTLRADGSAVESQESLPKNISEDASETASEATSVSGSAEGEENTQGVNPQGTECTNASSVSAHEASDASVNQEQQALQEELQSLEDANVAKTENTDAEVSAQAEDSALPEDDQATFAQRDKVKRTPPPRKTAEERAAQGYTPPQEEEKGMTLMEHLSELRTRLVRSFIVVGLAFIVCYTFAEQLFAELCKPLIAALPEGSKLIFTALPEAFFVYVQVGLLAAVFVASPFLFYQIWSFVSPGLYEEEKKYMIPMAVISAGFFIAGASFCFFMVFPYAFTFFVGFADENIAAMPSLSEYLGFSMKLLIAFGLIFEMPLFTFFLARMGVVTAAIMRKARKYAVLCSFIIAAILTPPDVISQLLMAFPMMLLYEMSIGVAAIFGRKKKVEPEEDTENLEEKSEEV